MNQSTLPAAIMNTHTSGGDEYPKQHPKLWCDEDSDAASSDNSEKRRRRLELKRAREGKKPKGVVDNEAGTAGASSDEEERDNGLSHDSSTEPAESGSGEAIVDAEVVGMDSKTFSFTDDILPLYDAENLLGAHQPPDIIIISPANQVVPHTELETPAEGEVHDFQSRNSSTEDDSDTPLRCLNDPCCRIKEWVSAKSILGDIKVEQQSVHSGSSKGEADVELPVQPIESDSNGNSQSLQNKASERPNDENSDARVCQAIEPGTGQTMERQEPRTTDEAVVENTGPYQEFQDSSVRQGLDESQRHLATHPQGPLEDSVQPAAEGPDSLATGPSEESSDVSFQNWLERPDCQTDQLSSQSSSMADPRISGDSGQQALDPARQSLDVSVQQGSEGSEISLHDSGERSCKSFVGSQASQVSGIYFTRHHLGLVDQWITKIDVSHPPYRLLCKLHEGYSALVDYGTGPNVHWRPTIREQLRFRNDWHPTHRPATRRWSIGQSSDGFVIGVHTGIVDSSCSPGEIFDQRIQRDEMHLVPLKVRTYDVCVIILVAAVKILIEARILSRRASGRP